MKKYTITFCSLSPFPKDKGKKERSDYLEVEAWQRIQVWIMISLCFFVFPTQVGADECSQSCKIVDSPAPALTEYLTNLSVIKSNILDALSEAESSLQDNLNQTGNIQTESKYSKRQQLLASFTNLLSFKGYFSNFDYKISLPITNEVPKEVERDHNKIESETKRFMKILERSEKRGTAGVTINNVCSGVLNCDISLKSARDVDNICSGVSNCDISLKSARDILNKIIKNNTNITRLYETSILDKAFLAENRNFILVSDDFESQIETYYNKDTLGSCSKCDGNSGANLGDKIKNISFRNAEYKEGVQKWRDAWTLLRGGKASGGQEKEQARLLTEYLGDQGISGSQADVVLDNLDKYGSGGLSSSNPLFNSKSYAQASIENEVDTFSQTLADRLAGERKVPIVGIARVNTEIKQTEDISSEIKAIFEDQLPFAQGQDVASQELQLRILRMHFSLVRSINILTRNKAHTEKLCDKQGTGDGKCSYE